LNDQHAAVCDTNRIPTGRGGGPRTFVDPEVLNALGVRADRYDMTDQRDEASTPGTDELTVPVHIWGPEPGAWVPATVRREQVGNADARYRPHIDRPGASSVVADPGRFLLCDPVVLPYRAHELRVVTAGDNAPIEAYLIEADDEAGDRLLERIGSHLDSQRCSPFAMISGRGSVRPDVLPPRQGIHIPVAQWPTERPVAELLAVGPDPADIDRDCCAICHLPHANPAFIDGHQCWRRYKFGGWVTMRNLWGCPDIRTFYEILWRPEWWRPGDLANLNPYTNVDYAEHYCAQRDPAPRLPKDVPEHVVVALAAEVPADVCAFANLEPRSDAYVHALPFDDPTAAAHGLTPSQRSDLIRAIFDQRLGRRLPEFGRHHAWHRSSRRGPTSGGVVTAAVSRTA
jgi:hypothetical protein